MRAASHASEIENPALPSSCITSPYSAHRQARCSSSVGRLFLKNHSPGSFGPDAAPTLLSCSEQLPLSWSFVSVRQPDRYDAGAARYLALFRLPPRDDKNHTTDKERFARCSILGSVRQRFGLSGRVPQ